MTDHVEENRVVEIVERKTGKVEKALRYSSQHLAEKADAGVNRNLDHENYFTRLRPLTLEEEKEVRGD